MKVTLRPMEPEDLDFLYRIEQEQAQWNVSTAGIPYSKYALRQYLAAQPADVFAAGEMRMVICTSEGQSVGMADLYDVSARHARAEVGLALLKSYEGAGIGRQILPQIKDMAHHQLRLHQLYAYVAESNKRSRHLFETQGFVHRAWLPDWIFNQGTFEAVSLMQCIL